MAVHVALRVAYDGTLFRGLASQPGGGTVQDALAEALSHEGLVPGSLRCGSRTDAGVSAQANVLAARLERPHLEGLVPAAQRHLPEGLWLTGAAPVDDGWNVRHAARRRYAYYAPVAEEDEAALGAACEAFTGEHDVTAFARVDDRSPLRTVSRFAVEADNGHWRFDVQGPGFLWNQVRRMVDACLAVGQSRATVADIEASLRSGKPHSAFSVAPAEGLLLADVTYEPSLTWTSEAGTPPPQRVARARQAAWVRSRVLDRL